MWVSIQSINIDIATIEGSAPARKQCCTKLLFFKAVIEMFSWPYSAQYVTFDPLSRKTDLFIGCTLHVSVLVWPSEH